MSTDPSLAIRSALSSIAPEADVDAIDPDEDLQEALDLDSMDFLNFMIALADCTGVDIPERDYHLVRTMSLCISYLTERVPKI